MNNENVKPKNYKRPQKVEIYRDSMQNYKKYGIKPAQLIIADVPYNVGNNFYGSNPMWYKGGDNKNGESKLAGKSAFNSDFNFNLYEYFHFCSKMLKKEDTSPIARGRSSNSPCMIVFCSFEQMPILIDAAKKHGFVKNIPLVFCKNYSPQVLKANMRVVGAVEYALLLYRDRLPKFRNGLQVDENGKNIRGTGHMVFNWFEWERDGKDIPKIHPAQKPVKLLKKLIEIFTDEGDVVIDPCFGSGTTIRAAMELGRDAYGFEIDRNFYERAKNEMLNLENKTLKEYSIDKKEISMIEGNKLVKKFMKLEDKILNLPKIARAYLYLQLSDEFRDMYEEDIVNIINKKIKKYNEKD